MRFHLRTLMIVVTAVCIVGGLAVEYPRQAVNYGLIGLPFAPTSVLWLIMVNCSRRPVRLSIMSLIGSSVGVLLFRLIWFPVAKPAIVRIPGEAQMFLDLVESGLLCLGSVIGTLLFGGALLIEESRRLRRPTAGVPSSSDN